MTSLLLFGCDPWFELEVQVKNENGEPVDGLDITLECPDKRRGLFHLDKGPQRLGRTNAQGRLQLAQAIRANDSCWIYAANDPQRHISLSKNCGGYIGSEACVKFRAGIIVNADDITTWRKQRSR